MCLSSPAHHSHTFRPAQETGVAGLVPPGRRVIDVVQLAALKRDSPPREARPDLWSALHEISSPLILSPSLSGYDRRRWCRSCRLVDHAGNRAIECPTGERGTVETLDGDGEPPQGNSKLADSGDRALSPEFARSRASAEVAWAWARWLPERDAGRRDLGNRRYDRVGRYGELPVSIDAGAVTAE